jgi:tRNA-specific 2-thiouridylase
MDGDGRQVGEHRGAAAYTVGQRQGLGVALGEPRYVSSIDARSNVVTLGRREDLYRREFDVADVSFVAGGAPAEEFAAAVRIRHRADPVAGVVRLSEADRRWRVTLEREVWAPAPGQAAVFYAGEEAIGGGRIVQTA